MNEDWKLPGAVEFAEGDNGLPLVLLYHPTSGQRCAIYLQGATITEWLLPNGRRVLKPEPDADIEPGEPIRQVKGCPFCSRVSAGKRALHTTHEHGHNIT